MDGRRGGIEDAQELLEPRSRVAFGEVPAVLPWRGARVIDHVVGGGERDVAGVGEIAELHEDRPVALGPFRQAPSPHGGVGLPARAGEVGPVGDHHVLHPRTAVGGVQRQDHVEGVGLCGAPVYQHRAGRGVAVRLQAQAYPLRGLRRQVQSYPQVEAAVRGPGHVHDPPAGHRIVGVGSGIGHVELETAVLEPPLQAVLDVAEGVGVAARPVSAVGEGALDGGAVKGGEVGGAANRAAVVAGVRVVGAAGPVAVRGQGVS